MDGKRFDDLSKVLGAGLTRQNVFHALAGAGAAGLAAIAGIAGLSEADAKKGKGGHAGKKGHGGGDGDNNNKGKDGGGGGGGASAEGKHKKGKGKGKNKKKNKKKGNTDRTTQQASSDFCPSNQDKVCHCPPGNTQNCQVTGAGGGHEDHDPLDCCCTLDGDPNPDCECPSGGNTCCKPLDTACANDSQCCEGVCCDKDSAGVGTCQEACCVSKTCEDFEGQCGTFPNGCGGDLECNCPAGQGCCDNQCFEGGNECCADGDCVAVICQIADCDNGDCKYTAVPDNQQGPLCTDEDRFCCGGDECCTEPQVCTEQGCCTPLTCAGYDGKCGTFTDNCGGTVTCGCDEGEQCCEAAKVCVANDACCPGITCDEVLCQVADCVGAECNYTPVNDNEQGPLCDEQSEFCCGGDECCTSPEICTGTGCCLPKTCAVDYPGQCGQRDDGCGGVLNCSCAEGQGCCEGTCVDGLQCCESNDCDALVCREVACDQGECEYTPVEDGQQGPLCTDEGDFCCNGDECCEAGDVCTGEGCCTPLTCADFPDKCGPQNNSCGGQTADCTCPVPGDTCVQGTCVGCIPETKEEACADAGRVCGLVSDGCGGEYDCGACSATQTCIAGVCLARGGKRCKGTGKAGHPCKGKKCKCKGGRRCHNRRCCEPKGDGSVHCNANADCCPGLTCLRRQPGQHKVCVRRGANSASVSSTSTPGIALGAILTGLLAKGASQFFGAASNDAQIALSDLGRQAEQPEV
jgi:hypothetical protein